MSILAFDTSNYTTSVAFLSQTTHCSLGKLLQVPHGSLGLRQQEALFQHIKALPLLLEELSAQYPLKQCEAIGVSTRPREVEGSYMPCFLAGDTFALGLASILDVPCFSFSHQQGHLAAGLWSLSQEALLDQEFFAWHLSGGTTELLLVRPSQESSDTSTPSNFSSHFFSHSSSKSPSTNSLPQGELLGGSLDLSAGQLIDRCGQKLGLPFPSGKALNALAQQAKGTLPPFEIKCQSLNFSLSGMENKVSHFIATEQAPEEIAAFVFATLAKVLEKASAMAEETYGRLPILFCGGVSASTYLRKKLSSTLPSCLFSAPAQATDNALGVAVLAKRALKTMEIMPPP